MESLAVALLVILILIVLEVLSNAGTTYTKPKKNKELPTVEIDQEQNKLTLFMWKKAEYLSSKEWKTKRIKVKERDNHSCQNCGATTDLHVHHMSGYNLIPNEPLSCLITLCNICHKEEHEKVGYPKNYSEYMNFNKPFKKDQ